MNNTDEVWVDRFLDLRNYVSADIDCWVQEDAKTALGDVVVKIDEILREIK